MATPTPAPSVRLPHSVVIAFASSLVKSKPPELTFREYFRLLYEHIAKGRREDALSARHFHLDRSSFWREQYEREKQGRTADQDEIRDLKLRNDELKTMLEKSRPGTAKKRKKGDEDVVPVPRSPKRAKREQFPGKLPAASADNTTQFDFTDLGEVGNILMRSFYQVNAILKSTQKTNPPILAHECVRAASAVSQVIHQTLQKIDSGLSHDTDALKSVLTAANRAIITLIMGFNRLSHVADGVQVQGQVIYAYVKMYSKIAESLLDTAKSETTKPIASETSAATGKKPASKGKVTQLSRAVHVKANPTVNLLANFLCNVIDTLDPKIEAHKSLFEGFAYVVLEKLGSCFYTLVFGHQRGKTIEAEIDTANREDVIEDGPELTADEQALKAAKMVAPYLIQLLKHMLSAAPAHIGAITNPKTGKSKAAKSKASMKASLAIAAKERLQRTLVNCVFGIEGVDEDDPFMDCLKMPSISNSVIAMPKVKEAEMQDWFTEEVWRLLGWDILTKDGSL